jgi:hypothetical protein
MRTREKHHFRLLVQEAKGSSSTSQPGLKNFNFRHHFFTAGGGGGGLVIGGYFLILFGLVWRRALIRRT